MSFRTHFRSRCSSSSDWGRFSAVNSCFQWWPRSRGCPMSVICGQCGQGPTIRMAGESTTVAEWHRFYYYVGRIVICFVRCDELINFGENGFHIRHWAFHTAARIDCVCWYVTAGRPRGLCTSPNFVLSFITFYSLYSNKWSARRSHYSPVYFSQFLFLSICVRWSGLRQCLACIERPIICRELLKSYVTFSNENARRQESRYTCAM